MAAPNRQTFKNTAITALDTGIDASQTSITVVDGTQLPSTGDFQILAESELMLCTARSGDTLTVVRGVEGTTGATHSSLTPLYHVVTEDALVRLGKDAVPLWGEDGRLALNTIVDGSGNVIDSSDFTIVNQNSMVFTDLEGTIGVRKPANPGGGENNTMLVEAVTPPFTRVLGFQLRGGRTQVLEHIVIGLGLRDSATGRLIVWCKDYNHAQKIAVYRYNSPTSFNATALATQTIDLPEIVWLKVEVDASNTIYSISYDSVNWHVKHTESKSAWLASIDGVGIAINCIQTNDPLIGRIYHYSPGA